MKFCLVIYVYLVTLLCRTGCHGNITVSTRTRYTIPVLPGREITLVCSYSPMITDRAVFWKDWNDNILASHVCQSSSCSKNVPNSEKYGLLVDEHNVNLTINNITTDDSGKYECSVDTKNGDGSDSINVAVLKPAPPVNASISEDEDLTVTAGEPTDVTCRAYGARPPATLTWIIPDNVQVALGEQVDVITGKIYLSRRTARVTPSRDNDAVTLLCQVWHPELERVLQDEVLLTVEVPPASLQFSTSSGNLIPEGSGIQTVTTVQGSLTSFACKSFGSRPAANISWTSSLPDIFPDNTSSVIPNLDDSSLNDTENILRITLERRHHRQTLHCWASVGNNRRDISVKLLVLGPPDLPELQVMTKLQTEETALINCTASNGYPAPLIHWYLGSKNLTSESKNESTSDPGGRVRAVSVLTFTPSKDHHGQEIICQVLQPALQPTWSRNVSELLHVRYHPEIVQSNVRRNMTSTGNILVTFTCIADARPPASIFTWFYNKTRLDNRTRNFTVKKSVQSEETFTTSRLIIPVAHETDTGEYECLAETELGNDSATINFTISLKQSKVSIKVIITAGVGSFAGVFVIVVSLIVALRFCNASSCLKKKKDQRDTGTTDQPVLTQTVDDDGLVTTNSYHETSHLHQPIRLDHLYLGSDGLVRRNVERSIAAPSTTATYSQELEEDGLVYIEVSHVSTNPSKSTMPIGRGETTVYASLDTSAMKRLKEKKDTPQTATTTLDSQYVDEDGLVYLEVSHDSTNPFKSAPVLRKEAPTVYASLDSDAMAKLKEKTNIVKQSATKCIPKN